MATLKSPLLYKRPRPEPRGSITASEVAALVALAHARSAERIGIGSGRDPAAVHAIRAITDAWVLAGGEIAVELAWPEEAASWLRHAKQFTADEPDLWIMSGPNRLYAADAGWRPLIL